MTPYAKTWHCSHCDHTEEQAMGGYWAPMGFNTRSAVFEKDGKKFYGEQKHCENCDEWTDIRGVGHFTSTPTGGSQSSIPVFLWEIDDIIVCGEQRE